MSTETLVSGKVKFYNKEKAFGFITMENGKDMFFHYNDCSDKAVEPQENDDVEFSIGEGRKGPCAKKVTIV